MVGFDGKKSYQFLYSCQFFIALVFGAQSQFLAAFTAQALCYQWWLYKVFH